MPTPPIPEKTLSRIEERARTLEAEQRDKAILAGDSATAQALGALDERDVIREIADEIRDEIEPEIEDPPAITDDEISGHESSDWDRVRVTETLIDHEREIASLRRTAELDANAITTGQAAVRLANLNTAQAIERAMELERSIAAVQRERDDLEARLAGLAEGTLWGVTVPTGQIMVVARGPEDALTKVRAAHPGASITGVRDTGSKIVF